MLHQRTLGRVHTLHAPRQGQFGPDHRVIEVLTPDEWVDADPFILLMDDRIDGFFQGGAHPHTGMETVTLLISGSFGAENAGGGQLAPFDVEWTTAGKGIIHAGTITKDRIDNARVLQLWVTLPEDARWTEPDHQIVRRSEALVRQEPGAVVRLYSGQSGKLRSPTRNHVPVTVATIQLEPGASIDQEAPLSHNGFFYPLAGRARIGGRDLAVGDVGWLDRPADGATGDAVIQIENPGSEPLLVVYYAGERQNIPLVTYGPFVGSTREDIARAMRSYQTGTFVEI